MKLMLLFGNGAAGKMTVGQGLTKITPFRLFHNHMTIEPVLDVMGYFDMDTILALRDVIFRRFAASDNYGMIFTFMWDFDAADDWAYVSHIKEIFGLAEEDIYHVELVASQSTRLERNATENRLQHKASKRDIEASNARLLSMDIKHRCESRPGELKFANYLRLVNDDLPAIQAAQQIKEHFHLPDKE
jgi:hypothetical protein